MVEKVVVGWRKGREREEVVFVMWWTGEAGPGRVGKFSSGRNQVN